MYVIYINDRPLTLLSKAEHRTGALAHERFKSVTHLTAMYSSKPRTLLHYADMLEKGSPKVTSVALVAEDVDLLWKDFRSHYRWLPAAGGVVFNRAVNKHLFIFRRGFWDLPKGKIDKGEDEPTAALREVEEETGINDLTLGKSLPTTFHTYRNRKEKRVLKPTYWFEMETTQSVLIPQEEEDIEIATWRAIEEVVKSKDPIYQSLLFLLNQVK